MASLPFAGPAFDSRTASTAPGKRDGGEAGNDGPGQPMPLRPVCTEITSWPCPEPVVPLRNAGPLPETANRVLRKPRSVEVFPTCQFAVIRKCPLPNWKERGSTSRISARERLDDVPPKLNLVVLVLSCTAGETSAASRIPNWRTAISEFNPKLAQGLTEKAAREIATPVFEEN